MGICASKPPASHISPLPVTTSEQNERFQKDEEKGITNIERSFIAMEPQNRMTQFEITQLYSNWCILNGNSKLIIPIDIINLISRFSNFTKEYKYNQSVKYNAYAYGQQKFGEYGESYVKLTNSFVKLNAFSKLLDTINDSSDIYQSCNRYFIKTSNTTIYVAGNCSNGSTGTGYYPTKTLSHFQKLQFYNHTINENNIIDIFSGGKQSNHSFIVSSEGKIYGFGFNRHYQLAMMYDNTNKDSVAILTNAIQVFHGINIKKIECGGYHSLFLCTNGNVYSAGLNTDGQCGHSDITETDNIREFKLIETLTNEFITDISVGDQHNLCLNYNKKLYCFGLNEYGCLGLGNLQTIYTPLIHPFFVNKKINIIDTTWRNSMCITNEKDCYLFGRNDKNQIGDIRIDNNITRRILECVNPYLYETKIENGWIAPSYTIVWNIYDQIICFGSKKFELNRKNVLNHLKLADNEMIARIMASPHHIMIITKTNLNKK